MSDDDFKTAIQNGITKINYYTYGAMAGGNKIREYVKSVGNNEIFLHDIIAAGKEGVKEDVKSAMNSFCRFHFVEFLYICTQKTAILTLSSVWQFSFTYSIRKHSLKYLRVTLAPCSSSFVLYSSASALDTPSLTTLGAPSTNSFASFNPSPVISRTALITLTFADPTSVNSTSNSSVFFCSAFRLRLLLLQHLLLQIHRILLHKAFTNSFNSNTDNPLITFNNFLSCHYDFPPNSNLIFYLKLFCSFCCFPCSAFFSNLINNTSKVCNWRLDTSKEFCKQFVS